MKRNQATVLAKKVLPLMFPVDDTRTGNRTQDAMVALLRCLVVVFLQKERHIVRSI